MSADLKALIAEEWDAERATLFAADAPIPTREALMKAAKRAWMAAARRAGMSITDIAKTCNTSRRAVRDTMKYLGCYQPPAPRRPTRQQATGVDAPPPYQPGRLRDVPDVGQRRDAEIARREGCSAQAVRRERLRRGLPRWRANP